MDEFLDRLAQQNRETEQAWIQACQGASVIMQHMAEQLQKDLSRVDLSGIRAAVVAGAREAE